MQPITTAQIRKIHAVARERGLDQDLLHYHIETVTGKDSIKKLTIMEAVNVIDALEGKRTEASGEPRATAKQTWFINSLMKELGWIDEAGKPDMKRLDGFLSKRMGIDSYKWLTKSKASKVIEGLKELAERKEQQNVRN